MSRFFSTTFLIKKAKPIAIIWTLLIFLACFIPANELNAPKVPLGDKVAHFILFGGFTFLWLLSYQANKIRQFIYVLIIGCLFGWLVEELQGYLYFLGRSKEQMDIVADAIGAFIGVLIYKIFHGFLLKDK